MTTSRLLRMPRLVRLGVALDTTGEWRWLALLAVALWPTWWWMGQRMTDGSDDPLGALALLVLVALLWQQRLRLRAAPRTGFQLAALLGAVLTTVLHHQLPDLLVALVGVLSFAAGLIAFLPAQLATAPIVGLSLLSLPALASLQFYAGFPLRVVTAEASAWLLSVAHTVERSGSSLIVDGQLIIVDAPCSGVQMAWLGYFTACVAAVVSGRSNRSFLMRLPVVSVLVLLGNVLRNTVLVACQASGNALPGWGHEAVGLLVLAAVCGGIGCAMARKEFRMNPVSFLEDRFMQRLLHKALWAMLLPLCAVWSLAQVAVDRQRAELEPATSQSAVELPTDWEGAPLRPLALSEVELRFAAHFPGSVARMTDGRQVLVLRTVTRPTRMLHPATDCYRGLGYRIHSEQLEVQAHNTRWRCFVAQRKGKSVRVCERIEDAQGQGYTDTSAWYWASIAGQSRGPWKAITVATPI